MLPIAILAGGLAMRLRPLTDQKPKALIQVAGRPFVSHQLEMLRTQGVERVVLCIGFLGEQIRAVVGDGHSFGLRVDYSLDGDEPLGTGGAVKRALSLLGEEFFVMHGDSYLRCSLGQIEAAYRRARRPALMAVLHNDNRWDRSNATFTADGLIAYNKRSPSRDMKYIDYGVSVFSHTVFADPAWGEDFDIADVCQNLAQHGELAGLEVPERFYEIGSFAGLQATEAFLARPRDRQ